MKPCGREILSSVFLRCTVIVKRWQKKGLLLRSTMLADGLTRYEYTQGDHVHHAVCLSCNKIFPVDVRLEPEYKDRLAKRKRILK